MRIMIIEFIRHNPWGRNDYVTQYYVNGKRMCKDRYFNFEYGLHNIIYRGNATTEDGCEVENNYKWDYTDTYTKVKNGITRNYTIIHFVDKSA